MALLGINHVVLPVHDLQASHAFYTHILGLTRVGQRPSMYFYQAGGHNHDLALMEMGPQSVQSIGHVCFDVSDEASLTALYQRCQTQGVEILGSVDHTIMRSFYIRDPDGHVLEFGVDVPKTEWEHLAAPFSKDKAYPLG